VPEKPSGAVPAHVDERYDGGPMGHVSLYRKHRPQTFADVVGQEHVTRTLGRAVVEGRLAHAYLFSGPRGTGKTSTARILAKCLNCEAGPTAEPCNVCTSCVEITAGRSLDVVEIDAASHGSVDDARDIREKVAYSPAAGRSRVYIVDECHMLSPAANNALLKVLEEPPAHVVFVFATTEPHKVLQTLLDRCQRYEMRAIGPEDVAARVSHVAELEGISIEPEAVEMLAHRSGGSMRDALSLLDQLWSYAESRITGEDLARLLGSVPEDTVTEAIDIVSDRDAGSAFLFVDRLTREARDIREFVRALTQHLRSLFLVLHAPAAQEILDVTDLELERLRSQANRFDANELLRLIDLANETNLALRQAVEGRLVLEVMLVRMARPDLHPSPSAMLSRIERLERLAGIEGAGMAPHKAGGATGVVPGEAAAAQPAARPAPAAAAISGTPEPSPPELSPAGARQNWRSEIGAVPKQVKDARAPKPSAPDRRPAPPPAATTPAAPKPAQQAPAPVAVPATTQPATAPATAAAPGPAQPAAAQPDAAQPAAPRPDAAHPASAPAARPGEEDPWTGMDAAPPVPAPAPVQAPPPAAASASPTPGAPDIDLEKVRLSWEVLLEKVKRRRIAARAMLLPATPVAWRGDELVIEFDEKSRFHRDQMSDPAYQTPLSEAFHETFGVRPRIRCVLRESSGKPAATSQAGRPSPGTGPGGRSPAPRAIQRIEEIEEDEIDDSDSDGDPSMPVQPPTTGHGSAVNLVKQGFGAEIVEEF
jgi:DNA polymerase III subunit gamma/tau